MFDGEDAYENESDYFRLAGEDEEIGVQLAVEEEEDEIDYGSGFGFGGEHEEKKNIRSGGEREGETSAENLEQGKKVVGG